VKRYRIVEWKRDRSARKLVGYRTTLRRACEDARRHQVAIVNRSKLERRDHRGGYGTAYG
jgi:hypothetical protein